MLSSRREVIYTLGNTTVLGLAGCSEIAGTGQDTPSSASGETPSPVDTPTRKDAGLPLSLALGEGTTVADGMWLSVAEPTVQKSIIADAMAFMFIERQQGTQYLVVSVDATGPIEPRSFAVSRDSSSDSTDGQRHVRTVTRDCSATCIGLPIETGPTANAAIVYQPADRVRVAWVLPDEPVDLFAVEPRCELREAELTERNGEVAIRFTVENVGPRDAGFRALVLPEDVADVSDPVGFVVPEGETVTKTVVPKELGAYSPEKATFTHEIDEDTGGFKVGSK